MFELEPHKVASILVWATSFSGMFSNGFVFCWVTKMPSMQNPFGGIAKNQSLTGFLHACGYFFFFAPMLYFDIKAWKDPSVSSWFGQLENTFYDACLSCHLLISLNRITSIWYPTYYDKIFTEYRLLGHTTDTQARNRRIMEITFVTQSFVQAFIFILELLSYFVFVNWTDNKLAKFALKTIAWVMVHSLDGFIAILFNKEFIRKIYHSKQRLTLRYSSSPAKIVQNADSLNTDSLPVDAEKKL
ncbi:unnamed protein product, partial [Mesorhabditis spiculigera]